MGDQQLIFRKTHEVDKDAFADLLVAAKGGRTMKDFAIACGVNPSTFTRIVQKANKGSSSPELLKAIAENASKACGITLEQLAQANGYTVESDSGRISHRLYNGYYLEHLTRDILVQALLDRGQSVRLGNIRYNVSKSLSISPDALIMTDAFGKKDEVWFVDSISIQEKTSPSSSIHPNPTLKSRVKRLAFDRLARFELISLNNTGLLCPTRFSLVVFSQEAYDIIKNEFSEMVVSPDITVIYIDTLNNRVAEEFVLPKKDVGCRDSYFMTTEAIENKGDYLQADYLDDASDNDIQSS